MTPSPSRSFQQAVCADSSRSSTASAYVYEAALPPPPPPRPLPYGTGSAGDPISLDDDDDGSQPSAREPGGARAAAMRSPARPVGDAGADRAARPPPSQWQPHAHAAGAPPAPRAPSAPTERPLMMSTPDETCLHHQRLGSAEPGRKLKLLWYADRLEADTLVICETRSPIATARERRTAFELRVPYEQIEHAAVMDTTPERDGLVQVFLHTRGPIGGEPAPSGVGGPASARTRLLVVLSAADWQRLVTKRVWQAVYEAAPLLRQSSWLPNRINPNDPSARAAALQPHSRSTVHNEGAANQGAGIVPRRDGGGLKRSLPF